MALTIIDFGDSGYSETSGWTNDPTGGYGGNHRYNTTGPPGSAGVYAEWNFTGLTAASTYQVYYTWPTGGSRASNSPFTIYDSDGTTVLASGTLNQTVAPNDLSEAGSNWELLGEVSPTSTSLTLRIASNANNYVILDAAGVQIVTVPENTTRATGNANDTATWGAGVVPDSADDVIIRVQDHLTINVNTTYKSMEALGNVTIANGVTLTLLEPSTLADATLTLGAGSSLCLDTTAGDNIFTLGTANGQNDCKIVANGTANVGDVAEKPVATTGGTHARIYKTGSNDAWFTLGDTVGDGSGTYYTGVPGYTLNYCDVEGISNGDGSIALPINTNENHDLIALFCTFDGCGQVFGPLPTSGWGANPGNDARFENCKVINSVSDNYGVYFYLSSTGAGTQSFIKNGIGKRSRISLPDGPIDDNYFDEVPFIESSTTCERNTWRFSDNGQVLAPPTDMVDMYFLSDNRGPSNVGNQHFCEVIQKNADGLVFETVAHAIDYPDCWFGDFRQLGGNNLRLENCLIITRPSDGTAAGVLTNPGSGYQADWALEVEHCTITGNEATLLFLENSRAAGIIKTCKSNLIASPSTTEGEGARFVWDGIATAANTDSIVASACTHNWLHNPELDPDRVSAVERTGFVDHELTSLPAGPTYTSTGAGLTGVGPDFVDPDRRVATYAVAQGWASSGDTEAQKIDAWREHMLDDPRIGELTRVWVRGGYEPQNESLRNAAHDGTDIGAVQMAEVGGFQAAWARGSNVLIGGSVL